MSRTPEGKRVKTIVMAGSVEMANGEANQQNALDTHVWQEDVRVIGIEAYAELYALNAMDSGNIQALTEVSRVGSWGQDGRLLEAACIIIGTSITVGVGVTEVAIGDSIKVERMFFPEGHGVDFDDGEAIYINALDNNNMANDQRGWHGATIYYVER
jgi:hypothetical protein